MKQKKLVQLFIVVSLLCIAPLPLLNLFFLFQQDAPLSKNLTIQKLFSTDKIEGNLNLIAYKKFHKSLNEIQTVAGRDGFLFLGNRYAAILDKTEGKYLYQKRDIDRWSDKLLDLQNWYLQRGIKFVFVLAPNKGSVYPEKLPSSIVYKEGGTITDDIVKYAKRKGVVLLDLRNILRREKGKDLLYYKTDTHWNNKGASIGFIETMHFLNKSYKQNYKIPDYRLHASRERSGDLAGFLKIRKMLPADYELNYAFDFNKTYTVCHGNIDSSDLSLHACKMVKNPIVNIFAVDQYIVNKEAENPEKLLLIADSFSTANSKPYNATFSTIWKLHQSRLYGKKLADFVKKYQPDIVIYQIVERDLYTQTLVEPLP